ncbi:hypothetical protein BpHYR1_008534 [Brachionus plicatilis]|uniref:Shisa N-terminal domain-containing protein n=1 Tax=Brachionus plicatilis TaxID=10195 RepID=A0A3M7T4V7_BRAPC|nr:hypothetical protein BpHYR1_008534 [Brachionus plicatilis]
MEDPGNYERYCSSYYDKHGLYNDGFPCPADKYCCQSADGIKMCCSFKQNDNSFMPSSSKSSVILSTISNINRQKVYLAGQNHFTSQSSLNILLSNSNVVISICAALTVLLVLTGLVLMCVCKCMSRSTNRSVKKSLDHRSAYSRNSNSTCSTSTSSQSPKTNQLTICCGEELEEQQKILSINPSEVSHHSQRAPLSNDIMQKSLINPNLASLLAHTNLIRPAFSSGSSNVGLINNHSANTTQTSFLTSHLNENNLNELGDYCTNEENEDFLVSTSSNLEFLKAHSMFNSTPLNYYPSINDKRKKEQAFNELKSNTQNCEQMNVDFRFSTFLPPINNF